MNLSITLFANLTKIRLYFSLQEFISKGAAKWKVLPTNEKDAFTARFQGKLNSYKMELENWENRYVLKYYTY